MAMHLLEKSQAGTTPVAELRADFEPVIESRRPFEIDLDRVHGKQDTLLRSQPVLFKTQLPQVLGAGAFHELQIIGVIDHTTTIRVFIVHSHRPEKLRQSYPLQ